MRRRSGKSSYSHSVVYIPRSGRGTTYLKKTYRRACVRIVLLLYNIGKSLFLKKIIFSKINARNSI